MKYFILFLLATQVLFSCSSKQISIQPVSINAGQVTATDSIKIINIDVPELTSFDIDDMLSDVEYIPLETNHQSIIGEISKVVYFNQRFYILDSDITNSIYIFNNEGKYINKISRKGSGPGEYTRIYDFDIDRFANQIIIFSGNPVKIIRNTMTGEFISEIHPPCYATRFTPLTNKASAIYLEYADNTPFLTKEYNLIFIDSTSLLKGGVLKYKNSHISKYFSKGLSTFYNYNNNSYFYPALKDTVYRVDMNKITPVYAFNFGKDSFDKRILEKGITEQDKYFKNKSYASFFNIFETDNVVSYSFSCNHGLYRGYYSKLTGKTFAGAICVNDQYFLGNTIGSTDKMLIDRLTPLVLMGYKNNLDKLPPKLDNNLYKIIKNYDEADNPVLITYKINL